MPVVWIPSLLRPLTDGQETVTLSGETVGQVIANLEQRFPGIRARLYQGDRLRPNLSLLVDGTLSTRGLLHKVSEDSEIRFIPAISGGSGPDCWGGRQSARCSPLRMRHRSILLIDPFPQESFDEGLIGDVALVRQLAQLIQHGFRQTYRDGFRGRFQARKEGSVCLAPIHVLGGIMRSPKGAFLIFAVKFRDLLRHKTLSLSCSFHDQK